MSFDLVADHTFVVEADIFDCLGFDSDGGEESSQGYVQIANVVYVWHVHTQIYLILCWWRNATLGPASPGYTPPHMRTRTSSIRRPQMT